MIATAIANATEGRYFTTPRGVDPKKGLGPFPLRSCGMSPPEDAAEAQRAFARMVLDRDNQVVFSRFKGSLPVRTDVDPSGLDRCGRLGLEKIAEKSGVSAHSMAMPTQMSEGWIGVLAAFFNDESMSIETAQQRLYDTVNRH